MARQSTIERDDKFPRHDTGETVGIAVPRVFDPAGPASTSVVEPAPVLVGETPRHPRLDILVPVHNEERILAASIARLDEWLDDWAHEGGPSSRISIVDNASTDDTWPRAVEFAHTHARIRAVHLGLQGRGRALRQVWSTSDADVLVYMDVDLSTGLDALPALVAPLLSGHSQVAIGSRLSRDSRVRRGSKREVISRSYNAILHVTLGTHFSDAQCGFKAIRWDAAHQLLPWVRDDRWFFDTELLILAEQAGLRIAEVPVDWIDDPDSRVAITRTATDDLRGVARVGWNLVRGRYPLRRIHDALVTPLPEVSAANAPDGSGADSATDPVAGRDVYPSPGRSGPRAAHLIDQVIRFGIVGLASSALQGVLYLVVRPFMGASAAAVVSLVLATFANTAANRGFTFGVRGRSGALRSQVQGLVLLVVTWALQTGALATLAASGVTSRMIEAVVVIACGMVGGVIRFIAMRVWMFNEEVQP